MTIKLIKVFSVLILTALAVVSLLFDFKENGHLNNWGRLALIITSIAGCTAVLIEILEYRKEVVEEARAQERQEIIAQIKDETTKSNYPLVPFMLFYTLRHTTTNAVIERTFKDVKGYKSVKKSEFLKRVGTIRLFGNVPYNPEEVEPQESECTLSGKVIEQIKSHEEQEETIIKSHFNIRVEIYNPALSENPSITLESSYPAGKRQGTIKEIRLYDNWLYQDTFVIDWELNTKKDRAYGLQDIRNSRLKIQIQFTVLDKINYDFPPSLTNLHLYFGNQPTNVLYFQTKDLKSQKAFKSNPFGDLNMKMNALAEEIFLSQTLEFETIITDELFNNQINQIV
jgi:hypothetical protein